MGTRKRGRRQLFRDRPRRWVDPWTPAGAAPRVSLWRRLQPPQLLVGSFLLLIAFGTAGLLLLPGLYTGARLGFVDALFTATSAVCVTGLIVVDTATYFTPLGQAFLLLLIQLGGLGIITLTTLIILSLGQRLSLRHEALTAPPIETGAPIDHRRLTRDLIRFTLAFEAAGALLLFVLWVPDLGRDAGWHAIFHAISAFCNAGFSTFSDSLMPFQQSPLTLIVVMSLIILGGIGFLTMEELYLLRRGHRRLSIHARLVLATTAILIAGGWLLFSLFEWGVTLRDLPAGHRLVNGLFMSVTPRTAGFNSVDYSQISEGTAFLTIILMTAGGSPGSTAGGLKTTTVALIGLLAWARLRGRQHVSIAGRSIPGDTIQRAMGLFALAFGVVTAAIFLYTLLEAGMVPHRATGGSFLMHMFEATSALNTVGLSMGATPELSVAGRWLTIVLMYIGRVGPLVFAAAIALPRRPALYRYADEDVIVG